MAATAAQGTKLKKGTVEIGDLEEIGGIDASADTIETTTLDSPDGYKEFIQGLKDAGEVSLSGNFNVKDAGQTTLITDFNSGVVGDYSIEFPASLGASWNFSAVVTGIKTDAAAGDKITFEATLKISGKPELKLASTTS